jgi:hypothetical protein
VGDQPLPIRKTGEVNTDNRVQGARPTDEKMFEKTSSRKADLGFRWLRSKSGTTYLFPTSHYAELRDAADDELRATCIDESMNPQND